MKQTNNARRQQEYRLRERTKSLQAKLRSEINEGTRTRERLSDLSSRIEQTYKQLAELLEENQHVRKS